MRIGVSTSKMKANFLQATGDDFAMMRQVDPSPVCPRKREEGGRQSSNWPDLLLIDGGLGQLSAVHEALDDLGVDDLAVVAISKGPDRHAGLEQFHIRDKPSFTLPPDSAAMHFLQRLRDDPTAMPSGRTVRNA